VRQDWLLRRLFDIAARRLPLARLETPYVPGRRAGAESRMPEFQEAEMHGQRELRREGSSGH